MAVFLSPVGGAAAQFFTNSGVPLTGGLLYTYAAGTTTPLTSYTTSAGTVAHTNPIILDSAGRVPSGEIWLSGVSYKFVLYTSANVLIGTYDNVGGINFVDASAVTYTAAGTGAVTTTVQAKLRESVSVMDFGATGDGTTDDSAAIQLAFNASNNIIFPNGSYVIGTGITKSVNDVLVNFGDATIINAGASFTFTFGTRNDTPLRSRLRIYGGNFKQQNNATTSNLNYIRIAGTQDFVVRDCNMQYVSNGGLYIEAGCANGLVDGVTVNGETGYTVNRGIWLAGDTATDFTDQLVDTTSITRNATPVPVYAVNNVKITNCTVTAVEYGIYSMNSRNTIVENCFVDISDAPSPKRCIAVNDYSPFMKVINNTLKSDSSSTGILVTQLSTNVLISGNLFENTFAGNRDIYVQYLANAVIENNRFNTEGTQNIQVDMGGFAFIKNNYFGRETYQSSERCVYAVPIDPTAAGTGTVGNTATLAGGVIFQDNIVRQTPLAVLVDMSTYPAANGNKPGFTFIKVKGNVFMDMQNATTSNDYPLIVIAGTGANATPFSFTDNEVVPVTETFWNTYDVSGTAYTVTGTQAYFRSFSVSVAVSGGAITVTSGAGMDFSLTVARSGANLILTPRNSQLAGSPNGVPSIIGCVDKGGTIYSFSMVKSANTYVFSAKDSGGAAINFASAAGSFDVLLGPAVAA